MSVTPLLARDQLTMSDMSTVASSSKVSLKDSSYDNFVKVGKYKYSWGNKKTFKRKGLVEDVRCYANESCLYVLRYDEAEKDDFWTKMPDDHSDKSLEGLMVWHLKDVSDEEYITVLAEKSRESEL